MMKLAPQPNNLVKYLRGHKRAFKEGVTMPGKKLVKSAMTILTLSICFFIPLFLCVIWLNYAELKQSWQQQGSIAIFVDGGLDMQDAEILLKKIKELPIVASASLTDSGKMKASLFEDAQFSQIINLIQEQDIPRQISVKIKSEISVEKIDSFVNNLSNNAKIQYVSYDKQWITQFEGITRALLQIARLSSFMFLLIVMVILGNTIANEMTDHKNELRLLTLIGASDAQTRRSFLYMGVFIGVMAAVLALLFLNISFFLLEEAIASFVLTFGININLHGLNLAQILSVLFIAVLVTWVATFISLSSKKLILKI